MDEANYNRVDGLFGFEPDSSYESFFPSDDTVSYNVRLMEQGSLSLPVTHYDFMLELALDNNEGTVTEVAMIDEQMHNILFDLEDGFVLTIQNDETEEEETIDFSYILETFEEDGEYPLAQMLFVEDSESYTATLVVKYLQVYGEEVVIEFLLFF